MDQRYTQKPKDLSFPKQRALTPEEAERVLKHSQRREEQGDEPLTQPGRSGLEMLFYGVILLAIVAFQFLSQMDPDVLRPGAVQEAEIVSVSLRNVDTGEESEQAGPRVERPDCPGDEAWIAASIADYDYSGRSPGELELRAVRQDGHWELRASGRRAGNTQVTVNAEIGCGERE
jgi:hypothetical protein